jgi:hypothetical protein
MERHSTTHEINTLGLMGFLFYLRMFHFSHQMPNMLHLRTETTAHLTNVQVCRPGGGRQPKVSDTFSKSESKDLSSFQYH